MKRVLTSVVILQILSSTLNALDDSRCVSVTDLKGAEKFKSNNVTTYSQLLFDVEREQVIVGARNNLYRLGLKSLSLLQNVTWQVTNDIAEYCRARGRTEHDCHNYITVLLKNGSQLLACGTYASKPLCTWREMENMENITRVLNDKDQTYPSLPSQTVTSLLANDALFIGGEIKHGNRGMIWKDHSSSNIYSLHQEFEWLHEPRFVGSFETETHIYFLFREYASKCMDPDIKVIHSRIARVCKNDPGVKHGEGYKKWTTLMKARLNCYVETPGGVPFYPDYIQSVVYHPGKKILYAIFTTPMKGISGSAVCAFNLEGVEKSFGGSFQYQENSFTTCEKKEYRDHVGRMCHSNISFDRIEEFQKYMLMHKGVEAMTPGPIHLAQERFTEIAVDVTPNKMYDQITILYVATTNRFIKKISVSSKIERSCVIEVWGPLESSILTLKFLKHTQSLYVGTETNLVSIPVIQCDRHVSRQACLKAHDPYCGWDEKNTRCTRIPESESSFKHWHQELDKCPIVADPTSEEWSSRLPCELDSKDDTLKDTEDTIQCQRCNDTLSENVGSHCTAHGISSRIGQVKDASVGTIVSILIAGLLMGIAFTVFAMWFYVRWTNSHAVSMVRNNYKQGSKDRIPMKQMIRNELSNNDREKNRNIITIEQ